MRTWYEAAILCEKLYGIDVNLSEGFFICPECGEPLYCEDWNEHDDWTTCPICEFDFFPW